MTSVILLNADFTPLGLISLKKAMKLVAKGKAEIVKEAKKIINTVTKSFFVPLVLRLIKFVRMLYGKKVPFSKRNVMILYDYKCAYCGVRMKSGMTLDHIIPRSRGGKTEFSNVVPCCLKCNNIKDNKLPHEVGMTLKYKVIVPTINEYLQIQIKNLGLGNTLKELGIL